MPAGNPLVIMHAVNRLATTGDGIANVCVDLAMSQVHAGHRVFVATEPGGFTKLIADAGAILVDVDFQSRRPRRLLENLIRFRQAVRQVRPDIIHAHTIAATAMSRLAACGLGCRVVATVHNEYQRGVVLMGAAHVVVGVSAAVSAAMQRRWVPSRVMTVLNGTIGSPRRSARPPATVEVQRPSIVVVGAVSHRKGSDLVVEMASRLAASHGAHTYFAGNVDWQHPRDAAGYAAPDAIHFLGFLADPRSLLAQADVFVLASRKDPAPLVLIEALEAGLPIVATNVDGVPEILGPETGALVEAGDVDALTDEVAHLLDDGDLRRAQRRLALERADAFKLSRVAANYEMVYRATLSGSRSMSTGVQPLRQE